MLVILPVVSALSSAFAVPRWAAMTLLPSAAPARARPCASVVSDVRVPIFSAAPALAAPIVYSAPAA